MTAGPPEPPPPRPTGPWLDLVLSQAPVVLFAIDQDGVVTVSEGSGLAALGAQPGAMVGRSIFEAYKNAPAVLENVRRALTGEAFTASVEVAGIVFETRYTPLSDERGALTGIVGVAIDITERRRAERRLALLAEAGSVLSSSLDYEATLDRVAHLVVPTLADYCFVDMIDAQGVIRDVAVAHVDPAREDLLRRMRRQYPPDPDAPFGVAKVLRSGQAELIPDLPDCLILTAAQDDEHLRMFRALRPVSYMIVPLVARGQMLGALSFGSTDAGRRYGPDDLTLAEELARRAALAIDNARLFAAEQRARAEAQAAARLREEFLAIASHELKTPLTTIKGYVQRGQRLLRQAPPDWERMAGLHGTLERQVGRLEQLVADLLDVSHIQRGHVELRRQSVDLVDLARQVLDRFEHAPERSPRHRLTLEAPDAVVGHWDADRLDQVLTNLVSNALKYSPEGGEVRVRTALHDGRAEIVVSDEGVGITPEEQAHLFRPFARGRPAARHGVRGVGLGLYIVAQLVERHGGAIEVRSEPGAGSVFTVRLPLGLPE